MEFASFANIKAIILLVYDPPAIPSVTVGATTGKLMTRICTRLFYKHRGLIEGCVRGLPS